MLTLNWVLTCVIRDTRYHSLLILVLQPVSQILLDRNKQARGVKLTNGQEISARYVLSNATHEVTFKNLVTQV